MRAVYGLFETFETAQQVVQALLQANFPQEDIYLISHTPAGDFCRYPPGAERGDRKDVESVDSPLVGGIKGALQGLGLTQWDQDLYVDGLQRGFNMVLVHTPDNLADVAATILNHFQPVEIHQPDRVIDPEEEAESSHDQDQEHPNKL